MLLLLLACAPDEIVDDAPLPDLDVVGEHVVGTFSSFTQSQGVGIDVQLWYPATEATGGLHDYGGFLPAETAYDEPPADCTEPRPVLVFSHGNGGIPYQSVFLTEFLASHGWVVVAPQHTHNSFFDLDTDRTGELAWRRPLDVQAAFDHALELDELEGCIDPDAGYAVAGHSFGGYTTIAVSGANWDVDAMIASCEDTPYWLCDEVLPFVESEFGGADQTLADERVWAAIPLAPAGVEVLGPTLDNVTVPTLVMGGELDTLTTMAYQVRPIFQGIAGSRYLGELMGGTHYSFTNACDLAQTDDYCPGDDELPDADSHRLVRQAALAFLEEVRGRDDAADWYPDDDALGWETP